MVNSDGEKDGCASKARKTAPPCFPVAPAMKIALGMVDCCSDANADDL